MSLAGDIRRAGRYWRGLQEYWRLPPNWHDAPGVIAGWLAEREHTFMAMLERQVFGNSASPYLSLLRAAGLGRSDVMGLVRDYGIEGCLRRLYSAGVHVTLDEFKGRRPIVRPGLELPAGAADFRVVGRRGHLTSSTGASRSKGTPVEVDVADLAYELPARYLFSQAYGLFDGPFAQWRPAPPGSAGLRSALRNLKLGMRMTRWFTPTRPGLSAASGKSAVVTWLTVASAALAGHPFPYPVYVPMDRPDVVARWVAEQRARGVRLHLDVMVSGAVAMCKAAHRLGLDISGLTVRVGGEPVTPAKVALFRSLGVAHCSQYAMSETGALGMSCADAAEPDDVHLLTYRMAAIQIPRQLPGYPEPIGALLLTNFSPRMTSVLLNLEVGDYGVLEEHDCGCPLGAAGLTTHLHTIRSYEKLVSAGMHFMGADLIDLLEVALPARFGGGPDDYQFVETEQDGETVLKVVVHPDVGALDETEVIAFVLRELSARAKSGVMMTDIWRDSRLLRVERARPYTTRSAKVHSLHVEQ